MLPAGKGDFFMIKYGNAKKEHYILIDGGDASATLLYKNIFTDFIKEKKIIEAMIFTHIDDDHIEGALRAISSMDTLPQINKIYINTGRGAENRFHFSINGKFPEEECKDYLHLSHTQHSVPKALSLIELLEIKDLSDKMVTCNCMGDKILLNDAVLNVISPDEKRLKKYLKFWEKEEQKQKSQHAELKRGILKDLKEYAKEEVSEDRSATNGSSIAFILECEGKRLAFLGDAYPSVCVEGVTQFYPAGLTVNLIKIPHHGSRHNFSEELYNFLESDYFLLSTKGTKIHPDPVFLGKMFCRFPKATIYCNGNWMNSFGFTDHDKNQYLSKENMQIILLKEEILLSSGLIIGGRYKG